MWEGVDPSKWAVDALDASEQSVRATAIKYFSAIVESSPVDEGTFRANWYVTNTTPASSVSLMDSDKSGRSTISSMTNFVKSSRNWQSFIFTNNLPYSEVIEFGGYSDGPNTKGGYSRQAPHGVVRVNATRFNRLMKAEARKVR